MGGSHTGHRHVGHTHFWERAMLSRRQFVATAAGTTGAVLAAYDFGASRKEGKL